MEKTQTLTLLVVIILALTIVNLFGTFNLHSKINSGGNAVIPSQPNVPSQPQPDVKIDVSEDDDPVIGDKNAPVTIIEFSDYQCPFCARFFSQTLPLLEQNYINNGKAKIIFRDLPLVQIHPYAQKAAEASECADEQGKFRQMD